MKICDKCKSNVVVKEVNVTAGVGKSIYRYVCPVCGNDLTNSKIGNIIGKIFSISLLLLVLYGSIDNYINM
jgi:hypothetical protein